MIKKTITYTNLLGEEMEETNYFHLSEVEFIELSARYNGDIFGYMDLITEQARLNDLLMVMQDIILTSYGVRSDDGKRFIKSEKLREEFKTSVYYAELFSIVVNDPEEAKAFGQGVASSIKKEFGKPKAPQLES